MNMTTAQKKELSGKALDAYPKLVNMYKKNKKANHKITISSEIDLIYGVTTKGDIIADFGQGRVMQFWDFIRSLD